MKKLIIHVADIKVSEEAGVGRVVWHWKNAFERQGYEFLHIGLTEIPSVLHKSLFSRAAYRYYQQLGRKACVILAHESTASPFFKENPPVIVFSHGLERRAWEVELKSQEEAIKKLPLRTKLLFPLWRLLPCDLGMRKATSLLLSNNEDAAFAQKYYPRDGSNISIFKNGVYPSQLDEQVQPNEPLTILFLATWIERKGIKTLVDAAQVLYDQGLRLKWILAGTGSDPETVLNYWSNNLRGSVEVIPGFLRAEEEGILARSNIFVLPSFFEGQPLSLLQAMESGRCCITTNSCGQRDLIEHGYNGLLHEPGDVQHLAFLIEQCANNEELRKSLGRNAKLSVKNRRWETVSAEVVNRVEEVLLKKDKTRNINFTPTES